jgi:hypothetical protein
VSWIETYARESLVADGINILLIPCLAARVLPECGHRPVSGTTLMLLLMMLEHFVVAGIKR